MSHNYQLDALINVITRATDGCVGIYAEHLPSGHRYEKNADEHFFMASTVKILIAVHCLKLIEKQKLRLETPIEILPADVRPYGILDKHFSYPGVSLSLANLLQLMLQLSDNTATDTILNLIGGPAAVMQSFTDPVFSGIDFTFSTLKVLAELSGIQQLPADEKCTLEEFQMLEAAVPKLIREQAKINFFKNPPNTATPAAMANLLLQIQQRKLLSESFSQLLIKWMQGCKIGLNRLRGLLPGDAKVAQKTGTLTGHVSNIGIIELPQPYGQLILAVYIKDSTKTIEQDEKVIAQIARTLFDYVLFMQK